VCSAAFAPHAYAYATIPNPKYLALILQTLSHLKMVPRATAISKPVPPFSVSPQTNERLCFRTSSQLNTSLGTASSCAHLAWLAPVFSVSVANAHGTTTHTA
jgi:hypothetical protein